MEVFRTAKLLSNSSNKIIAYVYMKLENYSKFMENSPSWEANSFLASLGIPHILWGPEGLLSHLQSPVTRSYPEPDQSSPYRPIPLLEY